MGLLGKVLRGAAGIAADLVVTEVSKRLDDRTREIAAEAVARAALEFIADHGDEAWLAKLERIQREADARGRKK